jgi:hypothetical protein
VPVYGISDSVNIVTRISFHQAPFDSLCDFGFTQLDRYTTKSLPAPLTVMAHSFGGGGTRNRRGRHFGCSDMHSIPIRFSLTRLAAHHRHIGTAALGAREVDAS